MEKAKETVETRELRSQVSDFLAVTGVETEGNETPESRKLEEVCGEIDFALQEGFIFSEGQRNRLMLLVDDLENLISQLKVKN